MDEAEMLFARAGVDGVSLRQIGSAAGSHNTNAAIYHFGTKDALVMEIFRRRLGVIDQRRAELLAQADAEGQVRNLIMLLDILCRPLLEQVDRNGEHSYAAFIDSVIRSGRLPLRATIASEFNATNAISTRIATACRERADDSQFILRMHFALSILIAALQAIDRREVVESFEAEALYAQALDMMAAALSARSHGRPEGDENEA